LKNYSYKYHRRSIRFNGYEYSQPGAYFLTICAQDRDCLLGKIIHSEIKLNEAGNMVQMWWNRLPNKYANIELDEFIVMPNHLHGSIIVGADPRVCPYNKKGEHTDSPLQNHIPLSRMIQWFKTMTTNEYIRNVKQNNWPPINKRLWQRNYFERIVCDESYKFFVFCNGFIQFSIMTISPG